MTDDIVSEAIRLLVQGGAPVWVVVALALVVAVVVVVARRVGRLPPPPPEVPAPPAGWRPLALGTADCSGQPEQPEQPEP